MKSFKKREYDKDTELSNLLESLKNISTKERRKIMEKTKKIILRKYKYLKEITGLILINMEDKRKKKRWYDNETYSKIVFHLLSLIDDQELFDQIKKYLNSKLKNK